MTIAVTGATGDPGGRVARELASRAVKQRLVVRNPRAAPQLPGADVAVAAYEDSEAMARALDGAGTVLLVSGPEDRDRASLHRKAVEGARLAGVERIVYTSFMGAAPNSTSPSPVTTARPSGRFARPGSASPRCATACMPTLRPGSWERTE